MIIEKVEIRKEQKKFKYSVVANGVQVEVESEEVLDLEEIKQRVQKSQEA